MGTQRLREALAGPPRAADKGPPVADGTLTVTPDPPEATEWRYKPILDVAGADSPFLDDSDGKQPNELFGKFTWRIERFSEIQGGKRELRSHAFDVGECKWYILVYPQGCDVCNHLSLFLCVADYDKLLPGWSHFAQFTIAVVNKDPKKSKYSDTLHRFCKKEHDWGWKKFMELSKVLDGFTVADTLVIKAQVQVILDKPYRPFRCLDAQYRRELVRVYLTNVESICRRFCEDRLQRLSWLREEGNSFRVWWCSLSNERRKQLTTETGDAILKGVKQQFFNEKEVTSTLVMDALYCGCRQLESLSRKKGSVPEDGSTAPCVFVREKGPVFGFAIDTLEVVSQMSQDFIPALPNDKVLPVGADGLGLRSGCDEMSELRRDALERDEKRLAELGRRTVEMYALAHIFTERLERAYRDHQAEKRMKDLIAEEEEAGRLEDERAAARAAADKEKRAKKKERQKAKKEADKAKKAAEDAERARLEQEKRAEIERRVAEANERRRQEEEAASQLQAQQQLERQQRQQAKEAARRKQQQRQQEQLSANGAELYLENGVGKAGAGMHADKVLQQQQQQHAKQAVARPVQHPPDADGPSTSSRGAAAALGDSERQMNGGSKDSSSSSSPCTPASSADDDSDAASSSDGEESSSRGVSSSADAARHFQHHPYYQQQVQQQQQQQQVGQRAGPGQGNARAQDAQAAVAVQQQRHQQQLPPPLPKQQQQHHHHHTGSIPTGYAAAVAGMRPPPPAEVVSAAAALAEQARRMQQLEEQASALEAQVLDYKQLVKGLEETVADRDSALAALDAALAAKDEQLEQQEAALSEKDAVISQRDAALEERDQQLQELREQVATQHQQVLAQQKQLVTQQQQLSELRVLQSKTASELRAAQAAIVAANAAAAAAAAATAAAGQASSRTSSKDGGPSRKPSMGSDDGTAAGSQSRLQDHATDLLSTADALASSSSIVAGPSPSSAAPWAAITAGQANAAGAVGGSMRGSGTVSPAAPHDAGTPAAAAAAVSNGPARGALHEQHGMAGTSSSSGGGGAEASGALNAHPGPLSYAESVSGIGQDASAVGTPGAAGSHDAATAQHMPPPGLQSHAPSSSTPRAQAAATAGAAAAAAAGPGPGSSSAAAVEAAERPAMAEHLGSSLQRQGAGAKGPGSGSAAGGGAVTDTGTRRAAAGAMPGTSSPGPGGGGADVSSSGLKHDSRAAALGPGQNKVLHGAVGRGSRFAAGQQRQQQLLQQQQQQQQYNGTTPSSSRAAPSAGMGAGQRAHDRGPAMQGRNGQQAPGGAAPGPKSYLSSGIAGVLHSTVPPSSSPSSQLNLHSYRNAAAGPAGVGPSSLAAVAAAVAGGAALGGMLGSLQAEPGSVKVGSSLVGKVPGSLAQQQHPFAFAGGMPGSSRGMEGYGQMTGGVKGQGDSSPTQHTASAGSMSMDDSGLDGFVHMHMIDDLLTE